MDELHKKNQRKRIIIIVVYIMLFVVVGLLIYILVKPNETCFDGLKNQNEEEVDCGGVCNKCEKIEAVPLTVKETGWLDSGSNGQYDVWSVIENPNHTYGGREFHYKIDLIDSTGNVVATRSGVNFILPGERKYVIENNISATSAPLKAELMVSDPLWAEFSDSYEKPQIKIVNKTYNEISSGNYFSESIGLVKNESPYDFSMIKIKVILKDSNGKPIAVNASEIRTVRAQEGREYKVFWPNRFPGDVRDIEAQADINVFDSEAFAQKNFTPQEFQRYRYE